MEDKTVRIAFNIRSTRSKVLKDYVADYRQLDRGTIYTRLREIYKAMPYQLGAFNGIISLSEGTIYEPIQIESKQVKTIAELSDLIFTELYDKIFRVQSRTYKRVNINNTIYEAELFRNYASAKPIIESYLSIQPIQNMPNTQPLLLNHAPNIEGGYNSKYDLSHPKLCVYNEVIHLYNSQYKKKSH